MTARPATECGTEWTAVVAVRVPRDGSGDLATNASRRLAAGADVEAADVIALRAVEPGLAATIARLEVRVRAAGDLDAGAMRGRLANAPGVERVDELRSA